MVREYDEYVYLGDEDIRNGGTYFNVGSDAGHVVEVIEASDMGSKRSLVQSRQIYLGWDLHHWRDAIESCGWLHGFNTDEWQQQPREYRRALLLQAMYGFYGGDPANEFPEYHEERVDPEDEDAIYTAVERFIR
jgi:hypothetical protein